MENRSRYVVSLFGAAGLLFGCGGAAAPQTNRTFYDWSLGDSSSQVFEQPLPRLNFPRRPEPEFVGVGVLGGRVRFSRPRGWLLRDASSEPDKAFVHYVSPRAYSFAVYERHAHRRDTWAEILTRYEKELKAAGVRIVGRRVPMATQRGQGRAYSLESTVKGPFGALQSRSREMLVRGATRLVLVQIVHQGDSLELVERELLRAVGSLEVE